jgi:hypothetical protein
MGPPAVLCMGPAWTSLQTAPPRLTYDAGVLKNTDPCGRMHLSLQAQSLSSRTGQPDTHRAKRDS